MARRKKIENPLTTDQIEEITGRAIEKLREEQDGLDETESGELSTPLDSQERLAVLNGEHDMDIFDFCAQRIDQLNDGIKYTIYKNGELLATHNHPYSWEELHKEYGGGRFKVQAKSLSRNQYIKTEQKILALTDHDEDEEESQTVLPQPASESPVLAMITLINQANEKAEERRRQDAKQAEAQRREDLQRAETLRREDKAATQTLITTLLTALSPVVGRLFEPKEDKTVPLMLDMMKQTQAHTSEQMKSFMARLEAMAKAPQGPTPFEMIKQLREAEEAGAKKAIQMLEMVDEKAERRAEEMSNQGDKEESMSETLIKNMLPAIAPLIGQAMTKPQTPPMVQQALPPATHPVRPASPAPQKRRPEPVSTKPSVVEVPPSSISAVKKSGSPGSISTQGIKPMKVGTTSPSQPPVVRSAEVQARILETVLPHVAQSLQALALGSEPKPTPQSTAEGSLVLLAKQGITTEMVKVNMTKDDFDQVIARHGLPEELLPWLNDYYAHFETQARVDDRKPATSKVH